MENISNNTNHSLEILNRKTINIISPGEIVKGMWVMVYEGVEIFKTINPMTGEAAIQKTPILNPWFKGIPYLVEDVAGPIIAAKTFGLQKQPPIIFLDTRLCFFLEVNEQFGLNYVNQMMGFTPSENQG